MKNVAVLTNDLLHGLANAKWARAVTEATEGFSFFLDSMRALGCRIIHLQHVHREDEPKDEPSDCDLAVAKLNFGADILPRLLRAGDLTIERDNDSGLYETSLDEELKKNGVDTVVITGLQTQVSLQTTAVGAFFRGYNVWVPEDCVVSARVEDKLRALEWLDEYCATISHSTEIIAQLKAARTLPRRIAKTA
jgi:nicotinamidase-related amidase